MQPVFLLIILLTIVVNGDDFGYINVRSSPYNVTGDELTDDTDAIRRALND